MDDADFVEEFVYEGVAAKMRWYAGNVNG